MGAHLDTDPDWIRRLRIEPRARRIELSLTRAAVARLRYSGRVPREEHEQGWVVSTARGMGLRLNHALTGVPLSSARKGRHWVRQGSSTGFPDLTFYQRFTVNGIDYTGLALELKRADGAPSDLSGEQRDWLDHLASQGWLATWARGAAEAVGILCACYPGGAWGRGVAA